MYESLTSTEKVSYIRLEICSKNLCKREKLNISLRNEAWKHCSNEEVFVPAGIVRGGGNVGGVEGVVLEGEERGAIKEAVVKGGEELTSKGRGGDDEGGDAA